MDISEFARRWKWQNGTTKAEQRLVKMRRDAIRDLSLFTSYTAVISLARRYLPQCSILSLSLSKRRNVRPLCLHGKIAKLDALAKFRTCPTLVSPGTISTIIKPSNSSRVVSRNGKKINNIIAAPAAPSFLSSLLSPRGDLLTRRFKDPRRVFLVRGLSRADTNCIAWIPSGTRDFFLHPVPLRFPSS